MRMISNIDYSRTVVFLVYTRFVPSSSNKQHSNKKIKQNVVVLYEVML
jgi:hypothetical protein